jgi:hypothetical protein
VRVQQTAEPCLVGQMVRPRGGGWVLRDVISSAWESGVTRTPTGPTRPGRTRCAAYRPLPATASTLSPRASSTHPAPGEPRPRARYGLTHALLPISAGGGMIRCPSYAPQRREALLRVVASCGTYPSRIWSVMNN